MASSRIRGITIEISGETRSLEDSLRNVTRQSNDLTRELSDVQRLLRMNPGNTTLIAQQQELLSQRIATTSERLTQLRAAQAQVEAQFQAGTLGVDQYNRFQREIITTEGSLNGLRNQLQRLTDEQNNVQQSTRQLETLFSATNSTLDDYADTLGVNLVRAIRNGTASSEQLEQALTQIGRQALGAEADLDRMRTTLRTIDSGGSIDEIRQDLGRIEQDARGAERAVGGIGDTLRDVGQSAGIAAAGVGAAVVGLVSGMEDYNRSMARLRTNANMAGHDLGLVEEAFKQVTAVTGETDSAVETVSNLLASGFSDNQLAAMIDQINGAAIRFSDTLKTEGIADGIQETFATGEAIGSFAELLERSGVDLETFNAKLQEAQAQGQGTQFVMQQMADLGFGSVLDKYKELNPEITANAEAQANLQAQLSELSTALTPLVTQITEFGVKMATWVNENKALATTFVIVSTAIGVIIGVLSALAPIIQLVIANWVAIKVALAAITGPIGIVVAAVVGLIAIFTALYKNNEGFKKNVTDIWDSIKSMFDKTLKAIEKIVKDVMTDVSKFFGEILGKIKDFWNENGKDIMNLVKKNFDSIKSNIETVMKTIQSVFQTIWPVISKVVVAAWSLIKSTIKTALDLVLGIIQTTMKLIQGDWSGAWETIKKTAESIMNNIIGFFEDIDLRSVGTDIIRGLLNGIDDMADAVRKKVSGIASSVKDAFTNMLKINSPSKVFEGYGININEGLMEGLEGSARKLQGTMKSIYGSFSNNSEKMLTASSSSNTSNVNNSRSYQPSITIINQANSTSPSEIARKALQTQRQLAMEWGV